MYLHSVWQSSVQHGEDGQIGAQIRNHSTGGTLQRDMKTLRVTAEASCVTVSAYLCLLNTVINFFFIERLLKQRTFTQCTSQLAALWVHVTAQENVHMTHKRPRSSLLLLSYNPGDLRPFETCSARRKPKDRFGYLPWWRYSTHTKANQLSCSFWSCIIWKGFCLCLLELKPASGKMIL